MKSYTRQLNAITNSANPVAAVSQIDILRSAHIIAIQALGVMTNITITASQIPLMIWELSLVNQISAFTGNDALGSLLTFGTSIRTTFGDATGIAAMREDCREMLTGIMVPVNPGDRLYLHLAASSSGTIPKQANVLVHLMEK